VASHDLKGGIARSPPCSGGLLQCGRTVYMKFSSLPEFPALKFCVALPIRVKAEWWFFRLPLRVLPSAIIQATCAFYHLNQSRVVYKADDGKINAAY